MPTPPLPAPGRRRSCSAPRAGRQPPGVPLQAQPLTFAALAPDRGRPAPVGAWQAVIQAWLAGLVAAGPGNREISAGLFICVKAASVRVPGIAGKLSVAGCGEAAAAACRPA